MAIHVMTTVWLHSHGDIAVKTALSKAPVIEGMIEVLFGSKNDEILELTISMLADFLTRNEKNGHIILNADPELDIFTKLFKSSSLFLKAATLLYLVKPKAKHLISTEWVPLVLRMLEFGDQMQTLFDVLCSPRSRGCILLARPTTYRHYVALNLNKESVISLVLEKNIDYNNHAFALLTELLCLQRTSVTKFLNELMNEWSSLNTMQILLIYLQKAQPEQRPMIATTIFQLNLLKDPLKCSIYREEAIEAITAALESHTNEKVQEKLARTLLILGGRFSHTGGPTTENWLLKEAGFDDSLRESQCTIIEGLRLYKACFYQFRPSTLLKYLKT
ncbi:hypothetical protein POM88_001959 [Heracleum sosnowskyi]|uniref:Putative E3 ubiquitin-protein ligase LIN ARM-like domain-containing protein n=1 Tax=Heracleum sosnowskyi TaxID=360622 RepID=A0AAD8JDY3_9APIA|nr:hypothetical protein POM88_001959 [Heracleum sosnowskyi]